MAFVKVVKSKSYFKRYQTRFRRRREGKTDYQARKALIIQDRDKFNTPRYRLIARITSSRVICQIAYATITGDRIICQADSKELRRYGLEAGFTNYAAAYATGLLIARRLLKQLGMDTLYKGAPKIDGTAYDVEQHANEDRRPFRAVLDIGLIRTTTGRRVFACLKGATDGGLNIPHSTKRYPGYSSQGGKENYDAKVHRARIFGGHVQNYMNSIKKDEGEEAYQRQFGNWDKALKAAKVDTLEKLYTKVHEEIKKNPERPAKKDRPAPVRKFTDKRKTIVETSKGKYLRQRRLTHEERKANIEKRLKIAAGKNKKK